MSGRWQRVVACSLLSAFACALFSAPSPALAQTAASAASGNAAPTIEELARLVAEQRRLIEAQRATLADQEKRLVEQEKRLTDLERRLAEASALASTTPSEPQETQEPPADVTVGQTVQETQARAVDSVLRAPEMAVKNLEGVFPGSFQIPGTDAALRIGGWVRMNYINSFDAIGSDDRFVTSSIPIEGSEEAGKSSRVEFSVIPSRFNFDVRTPTAFGFVRGFIEGDFAGEAGNFRLRHAFVQSKSWLTGFTWSTFSDPEAEPVGIDFEGLNAISLVRQPLVRWTRELGEAVALAIAIEEANPDLTGAAGVNQIPDLIIRVRWDPREAPFRFGILSEGSHIQAALLVRQLRGETENLTGGPQETLSTTGYGINLSGVIPAFWARERDKFRFAWNAGEGIGRYITDLNAVGGQDAFFDEEANELVPVPVASAYVGYEHWWLPTLRSTMTAGFVWIDNVDAQPLDALHRTERYSLNLAWSPIPRLDLVGEYLWGRRINRDQQQGEAGQLQIGGTFRF